MYLEKISSRPTMRKFVIFISMVLWVVGFTYSTGFGETYNIFDITKNTVVIIFFGSLIFQKKSYRINLGMVIAGAALMIIAYLNEKWNGKSIYDYIWVWLIIPLIGKLTVEERQIKWIGYIYGIASTGVLLIGNITDVFSGWDGNTVSMVQFFSYTVFISIFSEIKEKNIRNLVIFSLIYFYLLNTFNSRSAILFSGVMLLSMLSIIPLRKWMNNFTIFLMLIFPLIVALIITSVSDMGFIEELNNWSYDVFNKPIFNGRDTIWVRGIEKWWQSPFIGFGDFSYGNYHNSAITTLVAAGSIGYLIILGMCYKVLSLSTKWLKDNTVFGLTASFLIIWMQQSVELGVVASKPNVIPYLILGLLYARINTLEGKDDESVNNSTGL